MQVLRFKILLFTLLLGCGTLLPQACSGHVQANQTSCLSSMHTKSGPCKTTLLRLSPSSSSDALENLEGEDSFVILPPGFQNRRSEKYPVLVALPYTGGSGADFIRSYLYNTWPYNDKGSFEWGKAFQYFINTHFQEDKNRFIILVPPGIGSTRDHDWSGFMACIERYEKRVTDNLVWLKKNYNADISRVVLSGYSLGGDLSWALALKYPERYYGAILMGTRIGYRNKKSYDTLKKTGFRFYIGMGEFELEHRKKGNSLGRKILDQYKIPYIYKTIPAGGHTTLKHSEFIDALYYTFRFK